jgi:hypothetical protein
MAELKTKKTDNSVEAFINSVPDERKRKDSYTILEMMKKATGAEPKMWGEAIVGFGDLHYKYASGREGDWFLAGFSPRKQNLTLYFMSGYDDELKEIFGRLGKYSSGVGCLYIKKLDDVDLTVLQELISKSVAMQKG